MHLFVFKEKLKQLNPLLVVDSENASVVLDMKQNPTGWSTAQMYVNHGKRQEEMPHHLKTNLDLDAQKFLDAKEAGELFEFVCGVPIEDVPEYNIFSNRKRILARGWRNILRILIKRNLVSLAKARKVFNCSSLCESDYDNLSEDEQAILYVNELNKNRAVQCLIQS